MSYTQVIFISKTHPTNQPRARASHSLAESRASHVTNYFSKFRRYHRASER